MRDLNAQVMLRVIDTRWMNYLQEMDYLKQGIGLRGFGQRDPLVEYKTEAFAAFRTLVDDHVRGLPAHRPARRGRAAPAPAPDGPRARAGRPTPARSGRRRLRFLHAAPAGGRARPPTAARSGHRGQRRRRRAHLPQGRGGDPYANVGRNDPCPCGSGKKFKNCHGRNR